jgi:hypothetical protein
MVAKLQAIEYNFDIVQVGYSKIVADPYMTRAFIV